MWENRKRLVFTGDSITDCDHLWDERPEGLGFGFVRMIYDYLKDRENVQIFNRGHNGFTAFQMQGRWEEDCILLKPDVVTILVGINDFYMHIGGAGGYGAQGFGIHLERLLREAKEKTDAELILMEPFVFPKPLQYAVWEEPLSEFRGQVRRLAAQYGTGFVPLSNIFHEAKKKWSLDELTTDGIHLTEKGHEIVAAAWLSCYEKRSAEGQFPGLAAEISGE